MRPHLDSPVVQLRIVQRVEMHAAELVELREEQPVDDASYLERQE